MLELQKTFFLKLLNSKSGRVVLAMQAWKSIPETNTDMENKLANQFERGLNNFARKRLGSVFKAFTFEYEEGNNFKKQCAIRLVESTMSANQRKFICWRDLNRKIRIVEQCRSVVNTL